VSVVQIDHPASFKFYAGVIMTNEVLDTLVKEGVIASYLLETVEDEPGSHMREADKLTITFTSGHLLVLNTFCSGCNENTSIIVSE
jgi:hypothetical protein